MFRRGLAVLLCSAMLVGSLPETSFAAEIPETTETAAETETAESGAEEQENGDSTEAKEDAQASQTTVPETQTVLGTETAETTTTETAEITTTETGTIAETPAAEETADAPEETAAQEEETTEAATTETVTTETVTTEAASEAAAETEAVPTEAMTEEETTGENASETMAEEIENAEGESASVESSSAEESSATESSSEAAGTIGNADVKISNVKVTYNTISFDYNVINDDVYAIYVEDSNDSTRVKNTYGSGSGSAVIDGLNPSTEYTVSFTDNYGNTRYEFTKKTADRPYTVDFTVTPTKGNQFSLTAELKEKENAGEYKLPDTIRFGWKCFDADGTLLYEKDSEGYRSEGKLPAKITDTTDEYLERYLFENTEYTFEYEISEYSLLGDAQTVKDTKKGTTLASGISNVEVKFDKDALDSSGAYYTVTTDSTVNTEGYLFYRLKGSLRWIEKSFTITDGKSESNYLSGLSLGGEYECVLNVGGLKKTDGFKQGDATLKWEISCEASALDIIASIKLDETTKSANADYEIAARYRWKDPEYGWDSNPFDEYDGKYVATRLYPNTDYEVEFTIYESLQNGSQNIYKDVKTVKTKECVVKTNVTESGIDYVKYEIALDPSVTTDYSDGRWVYPYTKDADGKYTRLSDNDVYLSKESRSGYISGLESNKTYDVIFGYAPYTSYPNMVYEYGTMTFRTLADDREITLETPEISVSTFKVNGTFTGSTFSYDEYGYARETDIVLLYREQGVSRWKYAGSASVEPNYEYVNDEAQTVKTTKTFSISVYNASLETGKTYEYAVGICDNWENSSNIDKLKDVKKGTVTLRQDGRSVEISVLTPYLDGVLLKADLSGNYINDTNKAYLYIREKGKADASWEKAQDKYNSERYNKYIDYIYFDDDEDESKKDATFLLSEYNGEPLKSGTTYEYKTSMGVNLLNKKEDFEKLATGEFTFTAPDDDRKLKVDVTKNRNNVQFDVELTGNGRAVENYITVFYREKGKGNDSWERSYKVIDWSSSSNDATLSIESLTANTEYEYTIGVSNVYISSPDNIVADKQTDSFTLEDNRKLGTPGITTGYEYAYLEVEVEGLTSSDNNYNPSYVTLYTKDTSEKDAVWSSGRSYSVYYNSEKAVFHLSGLDQGKTYAYALVLTDSGASVKPGDDEYGKLPEGKKLEGEFSTRKSDYTLEIAHAEGSVYGREILTFKAKNESGYDAKYYRVSYNVYPHLTDADGKTITDKDGKPLLGSAVYDEDVVVALSNTDYTANEELNLWTSEKDYTVIATLTASSLKPNGGIEAVKVAEKEQVITTSKAGVPKEGELKANKEELWLNSWDNNDYMYDWVYVTAPEGVSDEVTWKSSNEDVVYVSEYSGYVKAEKPGEAVITATSVLDANIKVEIQVHVQNYGVVLADPATMNPWESASGIYAVQNTDSTNVVYAHISEDGKTATKADAVGVSEDPHIAVWDSEKQCISAKSAGTTWITLESEGYKWELSVVVSADDPSFEVDVLTSYSYPEYPVIKSGNDTYQIASGQSYYYELSVKANADVRYNIMDIISIDVAEADKDVIRIYGNYIEGLKKEKDTAVVTISYDMKKIQERIDQLSPLSLEARELNTLKNHTDLEKKIITLDVRPLPDEMQDIHAITNVSKTLGEVTIGEGWSWRDPETPLYNLPVNSSRFYYEFEATYTGEKYYNCEGNVRVYVSTIAGVTVTSDSSAISTKDGDFMTLSVNPVIYGYAQLQEGEGKDYQTTTGVSQKDAATLKFEDDPRGYKVTASKKGNYTLKPEIKIGDKVIATGSFKFTVSEGDLVGSIELSLAEENLSKYVTIKGNTIYFDSNKDVTEFKLNAKAVNRGTTKTENTTTKLKWTISDKSVADIDAKTSDRAVTVKMKGDGHAVIQVTATDDAKASANYNVEARNHQPRMEGEKVTINTAYDYKTYDGRRLSARQYGYVSLTPVYGEYITKVQVTSDKFKAYYYGSDYATNNEKYYVITPVDAGMAKTKESTELSVTTSSGFTYTYPIAVTVENKEPKVTAKFSNTMNLFYLDKTGQLDVTLEKNKSKNTNFEIESLKWSDSANPEGFKFTAEPDEEYPNSAKTPNVKRFYVDGSRVKVSGGKLENENVASGTVTVKLKGVIAASSIPVKIKYSYKKPKLTTADVATGKGTSTIIPSMRGGSIGTFTVLADKKLLLYKNGNAGPDDYEYYDAEPSCGNAKVSLWVDKDYSDYYYGYNRLNFTCTGGEEKYDIPVTLDSYYWREPLTVTHKVKAVKPTAVLSNAKLLFNTKYNNKTSVQIKLKDYAPLTYRYVGSNTAYPIITSVDIAAADSASEELLTSGALQLEHTGYGEVTVKLNASKLGTAPKGASYLLTPHYYDTAEKGTKELKSLPLKISFTDKDIVAKASGKGKIDITVQPSYANSIMVTTKFANLGTDYVVESAELTGEYSQYFEFYHYDTNGTAYIMSSSEGMGKLKAGQNYNLSIIYTLRDDDGDGENRITVQSSVLKIKPVQKAPKITVSGDSRSLYMAAPNLYRTCTISVPKYKNGEDTSEYSITDASGSLDTNKDGKPDIKVSLYSGRYNDTASLKIQLTKEGRHSVVATEKGKSYTVPVTVKLQGRDGITKDATVSIKVTVKK